MPKTNTECSGSVEYCRNCGEKYYRVEDGGATVFYGGRGNPRDYCPECGEKFSALPEGRAIIDGVSHPALMSMIDEVEF